MVHIPVDNYLFRAVKTPRAVVNEFFHYLPESDNTPPTVQPYTYVIEIIYLDFFYKNRVTNMVNLN